MKSISFYKKFFIALLIASFLIATSNTTLKSVLGEEYKSSYSTSEIVMEVNSKRILYGENIDEKKYMASTTKILTAIVIIENMDVEKEIVVTKETVGVEGSSIYLQEGEKLKVIDLLYGLMLRSGNDCAETLAVACSNSIENFAILMNNTAKKIGANNSNFTNPHGLHDDNHYTTAKDLALISCYAMQNELFRKIVSTRKISIPNTNLGYDRVLINKNKMLREYEGSNGIKTGFTKKAGRCLVSSSVRNGMELVCVVLNCPPMFERSKVLLDSVYDSYSMRKIVESDHIIDFVAYKDGNMPIHVKNDVVLPLTDEEYENLKVVYDYPSYIDDKNSSSIGNVKIYCKNNLIFLEKIYTILV